MARLGIRKLRPGPSGNESAPNHANYDEALANPYPILPDVLTLANGTKVTSAEVWKTERRPEIVELFEREVVGRIPRNVPKVTWSDNRNRGMVVGIAPGHRPTARRPRRQLVVPVDHGRYPDDAGDAEGSDEAGARDDHVRQRPPAVSRRGAGTRPAACRRRQRSATRGAADCRRLGLRVPEPDEHSGRQRRRLDKRHHRPRQQGRAAKARRLGLVACLGVGRVARARLLRNAEDRRRQARRHRRRLALRQGGAHHDGLRRALRRRPGRIVRSEGAPSCIAATSARQSRI